MTIVLLCIAVVEKHFCTAQQWSKEPSTWWPDPTTGLMWTGQATAGNHRYGMNWQEANAYCASLQLGGYTGWRLPTRDEVNAITYYMREVPYNPKYAPASVLALKGGIYAYVISIIWTSTLYGEHEAYAITTDVLPNAQPRHLLLSDTSLAICARPMEADLLQMAKEAQVPSPIPDLLTLKAYVPLNKARMAYQTGQFQNSLAEAKNALLVKSDFVPAYWAIGISYGMLGQWDLAVTNLDAALKIDKDYVAAKESVKWAKKGQKAEKDGKSPKTQAPQWDWTPEPPVCFEHIINGNDICDTSN